MTYAKPGDFDNVVGNTIESSVFFGEVSNIDTFDYKRLKRYNEYWDMYKGKHWPNPVPEGYSTTSINYVRTFAKKLRRFTFRNDWIPVFSETNNEAEKWVKDTWLKYNDIHDMTYKLTEAAGVLGDCFLKVQWVPPEDDEDQGYIDLVPLDPRFVYPSYNTLTGEMDFCYLVIPYAKRQFDKNTNELVTKTAIHKEIHTREETVVLVTDTDGEVIEREIYPNPYNKIMIIHGVNYPIMGDRYGLSDIEDLIKPQQEYNKKVSNVSDIIDYHAAPVTIIYGAKARQLKKDVNKVWSGLPFNSKVENLKSEGKIKESIAFIDKLKTSMHEIANLPESALGAKGSISNTSAVALYLEYEPLIEIAEDKRHYFSVFLKEVNNLILEIGNYHEIIDVDMKEIKNSHDIKYGELLPRDRSITLNQLREELGSNLESLKGALERLGIKDVEDKISEIENYIEWKNKVQSLGIEDSIENDTEEEVENAAKEDPNVHGEEVMEDNIEEKS